MRERFEYIAIKIVLWCASWMPKSFIYLMTKSLAMLFYYLLPKRRVLVQKNLSNAFPNLPQETIDRYTKEVYTNISESVAEILLMYVDRFDIDGAIVNLDEALEKLKGCKSQNGTIFMAAHFSNWELGAHFLGLHGFPTLVIGRKGDNELIDKYITVPFRNKYGNSAVYKDNAMIAMAKRLKSDGSVGVLIDQKTGGTHSAKVDFFGRKAPTTLSVASLKLKFDSAVVPMSVIRESRGRYRMFIEDPIEYKADE